MKTSPEALPAVLSRGLRGAYLVTGTEPLLIGESCDAIRREARTQGFVDREVHFVERGFDWDALQSASANLSLFATRRLLELRFGSAPDAPSGRALAGLAERPPVDTVLLVAGELERRSLANAWVKSFESSGVLVVANPVGREALPGWIRTRLASRGVNVEPAAAELLADRVEGNLLAAQQEIERIELLLTPGAALGAGDVAELTADSARYDVFELSAAAFAGRAERALRVLAGLRAEGCEPPLILWALLQDLRWLSRLVLRVSRDRSIDDAMRAEQVWTSHQASLRAAVTRFSGREVAALLTTTARVDRLAKGGARGDAWVALEGLVARIAGIRLAA